MDYIGKSVMSALFHLKTFGNFALTDAAGGADVAIPAGKAQALLTYLALNQQLVQREWLADFLWPDLPANAGRFNLRHAFFHLRRLCGSALFHQDRQQIGIVPECLSVDALMLNNMMRTNTQPAIDLVAGEALMETCQASFLPGFWLPDCDDFEAWLDCTRQSLLGQQVSLLENLAEQRVAEGHLEMGIYHVRHLTQLMPYDDGARRRLIRYLIDAHHTAAALAEFDHFVTLLAREIGTRPEEATVHLAQMARAGKNEILISAPKTSSQQEWRLTTALYCERAELSDSFLDEQDAMEEDYPASVTNAFALVATAHGGIVMPAPSGGLLAYFGYPVALEHAPTAAISAGLALIAAWADSHLQFRVGAYLGRTLCDEERPDLSGQIARIAQRICLVAEPGQLVTNTDLQEAQNCFYMIPVGRHTFRGLSRAFQIYRVEKGYQRQPVTAIIGRDDEQGGLNAALERTLAGASVCICVQGEAGIGKTTLARALANKARQGGASVIKLRCVPTGRNTPLHPIQAWLRECFGLTQTGPALIDALIGSMAESGYSIDAANLNALFALPISGEVAPDPEQANRHEALLASLLSLLVQLEAMAPVLIIVDDMHWIDPSTQELLNRIRQAGQRRTLLLLTSRNRFEATADSDQVITLGPLKQAAAYELAQSMARPGTDIQHIAAWVAKADGSPFFLRELMHSEGAIPVNVHAALQARLDQLGTAKRVAQMAAVLGRQVKLANVAALCHLTEDCCAQELEKLVQAAVLVEVPETGTHAFRHTLMQEAAYRSLVSADRQQSHLAAAQLLAARAQQYRPEQIAYHYQLAALWGPAAQYLLQAGTNYTQLGAHLEALTHLAAGIKSAEQLDATDDLRHTLSQQLQLARIAPMLALYDH